MTIPESQLKTWSNQGATVTAKATHESIRNAINASSSPLKKRGFVEGKDYEIYLQGSYKNTTNIRGDSDVDVVIQCNRTFVGNVSELPSEKQQLYHSYFESSSYKWSNFRADVLEALQLYFGWSKVDNSHNKSLKLNKTSGRIAADIVPCLQYRKYKNYWDAYNNSFTEGIIFYTLKENNTVINYPKLHYKNGAYKNQHLTNGYYKPVVRLFKNARVFLIEKGINEKYLAPSYFLECLLYNVPNQYFTGNFQDTYCHIVNWLNQSYIKSLECQNEQLLLFGNTPEQWSVVKASKLINNLIYLWNTW